ncbi:MAG TPA: alpha-amylase family glycosyl hydrolase [Puia sp.]|jgi:glycosidase|nr:alpha-amylase family glycosyl hydrolase [Puia sp.]
MKQLLFVIAFLSLSATAQTKAQAEPLEVIRDTSPVITVFPTNWWVGMKYSTPELMIHGIGIGNAERIVGGKQDVTIADWHRVENPNYLFLHLKISPTAKPGTVGIFIRLKSGKVLVVDYHLLPRRTGNGTDYARGVTSKDFIYFLMPDRWSNGDPSNDRIPGLKDQSLNRDSIFLRHGGDFQGIINHLDYLQSLGVTTLWMTPVIENDMPNRTEHGYAFTDHYTIEPRLGGAALYRNLSDSLHKRGMKLIQDAVYNHVGLYNWFIQDLPEKSWLHQWPKYTQTNYRDQPLFDPHASEIDRKLSSDGWFTREMPDLNQDNPDVAEFLIEHAIWSVEMFGVDGWRIDTYIYCSLPFMNKCNSALIAEYPKMTMFGETWVHGVANQAYFVRNNLNVPFKSNLMGAVDFQLLFNGIQPAVKDTTGSWDGGVGSLYNTLSDDFLYQDPTRNVIFLDNHDMTRFFSQIGEDPAGQKIGIEWLLTERGIPQLYYGTEICMKGIDNPDGWVRLDFPGGWPGDKKNAFTGEGLAPYELEVQQLTKTLANFRLHSSALKAGKMMQYAPRGGLYVYFRYDANQTILCAMNPGNNPHKIDFSHYAERTAGFTHGTDIPTGQTYSLDKPVEIPPRTMWVLELKK